MATARTLDRLRVETADGTRGIDAVSRIVVPNGKLSITGVDECMFDFGFSAAASGRETLVDGTVTVLTASVSATSNILLTGQDANVSGALHIENVVAATSFDIVSSNLGDDGEVCWFLFN